MGRLILAVAFLSASGFAEEFPNKEALKAYQNFWQGFEAYERVMNEKAKQKFKEEWDKLKEKHGDELKKIADQQIEKLKSTAESYRKQLENYPNAENKPYVMLNLARTIGQFADVLSQDDRAAGQSSRLETISLINDIVRYFPRFEKLDEAIYLRALTHEKMGQDKNAISDWRRLTALERNSLYHIYGLIAIGDHLFKKNQPAEAVAFYQRATNRINRANFPIKNKDYELVRAQYRLAWATYRSAQLKLSYRSAAALLVPNRDFQSADQRKRIQADAVEIAGDSLFERDSVKLTRRELRKKQIKAHAPKVGMRVLTQYMNSRAFSRSVEVASFLIKQFPRSTQIPGWLEALAEAHRQQGNRRKEVGALERLSMLLPSSSLWRSMHKDNFNLIREMETKAVEGAERAARYRYQHGVSSGNANSFMAAAALYDTLIAFEPQAKRSVEWRLKHAHSYYFANRLDRAAELYEELKRNFNVNNDVLEISAYQLVLTREKQWRETFRKAEQRSKTPGKDPVAIAALKRLETAAEEFVNKFPEKKRGIDLLLVVASVYRDHERYVDATRFWERVLVSAPNPSQRAIAVRGIVMAAMASKSNGELIKLSRRFLKLEDWQALGLNLGNELRGVLASATLDEGKRLNKKGEVLEAGALLVKISEEFKSLPQRDKIFRDGAYMLAIAGDWPSAQKAALSYQDSGLKRNAGDMKYLLARADEFQMRFASAAKGYYELAQRYPRHSRSLSSLQRAEKLAMAENDYTLAAKAAGGYARRAKKVSQKLKYFKNSVNLHLEADDAKSALEMAKMRRTASRSLGDKLESDLLVAKTLYETGEETKALVGYEQISREIKRHKAKLNKSQYRLLAGESNFLLGEESKEQFYDYNIFERPGTMSENVRRKTKFFEAMVRNYDRAAGANSPEFSPRARYELAKAAEAFSDDLNSIRVRRPKLTEKVKDHYGKTAKRLKRLAKKYYSTNLLVRNKRPRLYRNNEWVRKSAVRLTGYGDGDYANDQEFGMPTAVNMDIPYQWSL